MTSRRTCIAVLVGVAATVVLIDRLTKAWAVDVMLPRLQAGGAGPIDVIGSWIRFTYTENTGAAFSLGTGYTWTALLSEQVRQADAIYWFSDFQDRVDFQQVMVVKENLLRRKQKLYIQPYMHGTSFDLVKSQLVEPTGGDVIEAILE